MRLPHLIAACCLAAVTHALPAAAYPDKPVNVVVGFAPGGTNDILARLVSSELEKRLGQPFIVENKPGANSMISANYVKAAPNDGYTLLVISSGGLTVNPAVYKPGRLTYDPVKDFTPIALLAKFPLVITTGPKLKDVKSVAELIALQKSQKMPLTHGVATSTFQLAAELMATMAGVDFTHVPYRGSGPVVVDLTGGQIDLAFLDSAAVIPSVNAGRLHALAVTTIERSPVLPDVPTVAESGLAGYDVPIWSALVAPAGTPPEVVRTLNAALADILKQPEIKERYQQLGMDTGSADGEVLGRAISTDIERWTKVARDAGIQLE
ncbi:tripartite tricarboxylate transporter substrate binding protein [Bordetella sp. BOR01]|uniref:Bug family tripartite tricarboxylate transporter substrate binding protein n=1 Tax=Bordetella sp. BOR01 TaxID=2854779 RepID=UPI001C476973|nr:tripartite tricarboxylate transporter substrate binding protein [Bordetella sp. BOR01]MBV7485822.1 tripartite tricarboxylate transporter substrate binding protein [Bordetella sp. BOR01]